MPSETPRTWTLVAEPNEEHGGPGALTWRVNGATPERDRERIRAIELEPTLDLLERILSANGALVERGAAEIEAEDLLREHGRLGGEDGCAAPSSLRDRA